MAIPILSRVKSALPFGNDPGQQAASSPTEQLLGHTAQLPDPSTIKPRIGMAPMGASGRANFYGLPQWDELNPKLVGQRGMLLLDEMYRTDAHIRRLILAGWSPVVAGTWTLEPYGAEEATDQDRQIADAVWWMLTQWMSPNFYEHLYQLGPILLRSGFAPFEQIWGTCEYKGKTLLGPRKLDVRLPKTVWRWWQDDFGDLTHIGQLLPNKADVVIPASELVYYRLGAEGDNWMGVSLLRHAYKHWYLKDKFERLDAVGQERRAVGVPIAYHSPDIDPQILDGVEAALANMHMSEVAYLMLPGFKMGEAPQDAGHGNQWLIDVIQFDSSSGPGIQSSIDYHQTAISASFLTDFLELGHHQVGARATAEVQEDPFLTAINGALLPPVIPPLNRLIDRIVKLNWDSAKGSPQLRLTLNDEASLSEIAAYVVPLIQAGAMQADPDLEDWLRDRADMPPANAEVREQTQAAKAAGLQAAAEMAQRGETPGEEPPGANSDPAQQGAGAKPPAPASSTAGTTPPGDATATLKKTAAAKPSNGKQLDQGDGPVAAGVIVHAHDTGRVLTVQRTPDDTDAPDVFASVEFPGGKLDPDDPSPWHGAVREFGEETGAKLPDDVKPASSFDSPDGKYRAFVAHVAHETDVQMGHSQHGEIVGSTWRAPASLADGTMSDRAKRLLPGLTHALGSRTLDDAPLSSGTSGGDGLQMVPDIAGECTCKVKDGERVPSASCPVHGPAIKAARKLDGRQSAPSLKLLSAAGYTPTMDDEPVEVRYPDGSWHVAYVQMIGPNGDIAVADKIAGSPEWLFDKKDVRKPDSRKLDSAAAEPTAKWFERLLSQDQLRQAFDGCRDHIQAAVGPAAQLVARQQAHQAANGTPMTNVNPPAELVDALTKHYTDMYQLGHQTVTTELAKQRAALGKTLDDPASTDAGLTVASRLAKARQRGEHSARNIVAKINERLGRDQITGLKDPAALQKGAEQAAAGQLRMEALANTTAMVNDGRNDAGTSAPDVAGAYYTAVLDERTCGPCEQADDGTLLSPEDAVGLGPPNPDCDGSDFCRCALIWVLSDDPAALQAVT